MRESVKRSRNRKTEIWVQYSNFYDGMLFSIQKPQISNIFAYMKRGFPHPNYNKMSLKFDKILFEVSWKKNILNDFFLYVHDSNLGSIFHRYICDLFNAPDVFFLSVESKKFFSSIIKPIKRSVLAGEFLSELDLKEFYSEHSEHDFSEIRCKIQRSWDSHYYRTSWDKLLEKNDEVLKVKNLIIRWPGLLDKTFIMKFQGEHLLMEKAQIDLSDFKRFLSRWHWGNDNLKSMIIYIDEGFLLDSNTISDFLKSHRKRLHQSNLFFEYDSPIKQFHSFAPDVFDCKDGICTTRRIDGKLATIKLSPTYFMFFVWENEEKIKQIRQDINFNSNEASGKAFLESFEAWDCFLREIYDELEKILGPVKSAVTTLPEDSGILGLQSKTISYYLTDSAFDCVLIIVVRAFNRPEVNEHILGLYNRIDELRKLRCDVFLLTKGPSIGSSGGAYIKLIDVPFRKLYEYNGWRTLCEVVEASLVEGDCSSVPKEPASEAHEDSVSYISQKGGTVLVDKSEEILYKHIEDDKGNSWPDIDEIVKLVEARNAKYLESNNNLEEMNSDVIFLW